MKRMGSLFSLMAAVVLLFYGAQRFDLDVERIPEQSSGFVILWSVFAFLVIGAHLYQWLEVDKEKAERRHARKRGYS